MKNNNFDVCKKDGKCVINVYNRKSCKSCRYRACLAAGMRYENETRLKSEIYYGTDKYFSNVSHLIVDAHQELSTTLQFYYSANNFNVIKICSNDFKCNIDKFYNKIVYLLDDDDDDDEDDYEYGVDLIKYNNKKPFLDIISLIIFSNLFDFHNDTFNQFDVFRDFSKEFKNIIKECMNQSGENKLNKYFRIICFLYVSISIDNILNDKTGRLANKYKAKLNDLARYDFSNFRFQTVDIADMDANTETRVNSDSLYNLDVFLLLIDDIELLINRYLKEYLDI